MFRNIEYNDASNRSTGHVNCPLMSYWGRYKEDLHDAWDGNEPVVLGDLSLPQSTIQDPHFIEVQIDGKGPARSHINQMLKLSEQQDILIAAIRENVAAYFDTVYAREWKGAGAPLRDSVIDNAFRPTLMVVYPDAVQVYCSSFFDEEHGLQFLISGDDVVVDMDLTYEPSDVADEPDLTDPDIKRYLSRGAIPQPPRLGLSEADMELIIGDSRQFFIQFSERRDRFLERLDAFISATSEPDSFAGVRHYFQGRLDESCRIEKLCALEQTILIDLAENLGVGFRTNNLKTPLWYSWRSVLKGKACSLHQIVAVLGTTYVMIMAEIETLRGELERGEIDDEMYQEFVKEVEMHPVENWNIYKDLHQVLMRSES